MAQALTELESATLGAIAQLQPCSTYQVRRAFARSATAAWSASAGTIYPVIERLTRLGLVRAQVRSGDPRGRRDLSVTAKGRRAIRAWVLGLTARDAASMPDPVRTRLHFLELLESKDERAAFLDAAARLTDAAIAQTKIFLKAERAHARIDYLASLGALHQLEARRKWLRLVRRQLAL